MGRVCPVANPEILQGAGSNGGSRNFAGDGKQWRIQKFCRGGKQLMYQPRRHLSQIKNVPNNVS